MAKSDKLYSESPSIARDEDGSVGIKKPTKADAENMGIEGNPLEGAGDGMPVDPHQEERTEARKRHLQELKDMYKRHESELVVMNKRHYGIKDEPSTPESKEKKDK